MQGAIQVLCFTYFCFMGRWTNSGGAARREAAERNERRRGDDCTSNDGRRGHVILHGVVVPSSVPAGNVEVRWRLSWNDQMSASFE